jgi:hypothetical protein
MVGSTAPKNRLCFGWLSQRIISLAFVSSDTFYIKSTNFRIELIFFMTGRKYTIFILSAYRWPVQARSIRNACFTWVTFCALAATLGCRSPSPDWNGNWHLDLSKSTYQRLIVTISISVEGEYRYDAGDSSFTFRCDGKDRPIGKNRTQVCVKGSATTLDLTRKQNGAKTNTYHWELSADSKVLTAITTAFPPSGPATISQNVASRISGSNGFAGQWLATSYLQRHADMTLRVNIQTLHLSYPSGGQYVDASLDGVDAAVHGPHAPEGMTYSTRLAGRREILTLAKRNGEALTQGSLELSGDGRVITESWWNPGQPADKGTFVYEKK